MSNSATPYSSFLNPSSPEIRDSPEERNVASSAIADFEKRQRELDDREREIAERENSFEQAPSETKKNWPPFPSWFPIRPCFYQDFDVDFSDVTRPLIKCGYYLWLFYFVSNLFNVIVTMVLVISNNFHDFITMFISALILMVAATLLSYFFWYRPLYRALKKDSSFSFFMFFTAFIIQLLVMAIQTLGISMFGSCGWIAAVLHFTKENKTIGAVMMAVAIAYTLNTLIALLLLFHCNMYYRSGNLTMDNAKREVFAEISQNNSLRSAVRDVGISSIKQTTYSSFN